MSAAKKLPAASDANSACNLEDTVSKTISLIDLLQARLTEQAGASLYPSLPGFDAKTSFGICGIQLFANEVKAELLKCAKIL